VQRFVRSAVTHSFIEIQYSHVYLVQRFVRSAVTHSFMYCFS